MSFGKWLEDVLSRAGSSKSDLARELGITPQAISQWISGKTNPSGKHLLAIVKTLKIELRELTSIDVKLVGAALVAGFEELNQARREDLLQQLEFLRHQQDRSRNR